MKTLPFRFYPQRFKDYVTGRGGGGVSGSVTDCYVGERGVYCLGMRYITEQISVETIISLKMVIIGSMAKTVKEGGQINANENTTSPISSAKVITKGVVQKFRNS